MVGAVVWSDATGGGKKFEVSLSYIVGIGVLSPKILSQKFQSESYFKKKQKQRNKNQITVLS